MLVYTSWNRSNNLYQPAFAKGFTQWSIGSLGDWWILMVYSPFISGNHPSILAEPSIHRISGMIPPIKKNIWFSWPQSASSFLDLPRFESYNMHTHLFITYSEITIQWIGSRQNCQGLSTFSSENCNGSDINEHKWTTTTFKVSIICWRFPLIVFIIDKPFNVL